MMNELLGRILDAHGGMDRWQSYEKVEATIVSGGGLFPLKGIVQDPSPRRMTDDENDSHKTCQNSNNREAAIKRSVSCRQSPPHLITIQ
jgi:hypothetical protein